MLKLAERSVSFLSGASNQERTVPLVQDQVRRIFERLAKLRGRSVAPSQSSLVHVAGALEDVTEAVKDIEQRLRRLEKDRPQPNAPAPPIARPTTPRSTPPPLGRRWGQCSDANRPRPGTGHKDDCGSNSAGTITFGRGRPGFVQAAEAPDADMLTVRGRMWTVVQ